MENKNSYSHQEVKEMFEAYQNYQLAKKIGENSNDLKASIIDMQKYGEIARDKIPEDIKKTLVDFI